MSVKTIELNDFGRMDAMYVDAISEHVEEALIDLGEIDRDYAEHDNVTSLSWSIEVTFKKEEAA